MSDAETPPSHPGAPGAGSGDGRGEDERPRPLVPVVRRQGPQLPQSVEGPLDVALGAAAAVARPVVAVGGAVTEVVGPVVRGAWSLFLHPPFVPPQWTAGAVAARLADDGRRLRFAAGEDLTDAGGQTLDVWVPAVMDPVLDRVDITALVLERVDLERIVTAVLDQLDLTAVVVQRVDLDAIVTRALDGMDLNDVVLQRVDLKRVIEAALAQLDLTEIVRSNVDLAGIAEEVIDDVDLPEIIRESSTGVAAEVIDAGRMSAVSGDELVSRLVDRVMLRRSKRRTSVDNLKTDELNKGRFVDE